MELDNFSNSSQQPIEEQISLDLDQKRDILAKETMQKIQEMFPKEAKTFGLEGYESSSFVVIKTALRTENTISSINGTDIPVVSYSHLLATPKGLRILEFLEYPNTNYKNYEKSEEAFQIYIQSKNLKNPTSGMRGTLVDNLEVQDQPYYIIKDGSPEAISFGSRGPNNPVILTLGEDNGFANLRKPKDTEELENLINEAKKNESIIRYTEDEKSAQNDIALMESLPL